jgi:ribonuclease HI
MKLVNIYADGACSKNGTPDAKGGWAAILIDLASGTEKEIGGRLLGEKQTNQRAEVTAIIEALSLIKYECTIVIYTDSMYVIGTMKHQWKRKCNNDLWNTLDLIIKVKSLDITWVHCKGHSGNAIQERCDKLAVQYTTYV